MKTMILGAKNYVGMEQIWPSKEIFIAIGTLSFQQASTLRHRGALTTVSQTFASSCQMSRYYSSSNPSDSLLNVWYKVEHLPTAFVKDISNIHREPLIASSLRDPRREGRQVFLL